MQVTFRYLDFDGQTKASEATVHEDAEAFWAVNLETFGHGKRACKALNWHPIKAALKHLVGGREIVSWTETQP